MLSLGIRLNSQSSVRPNVGRNAAVLTFLGLRLSRARREGLMIGVVGYGELMGRVGPRDGPRE
jgi:hypothetical protein